MMRIRPFHTSSNSFRRKAQNSSGTSQHPKLYQSKSDKSANMKVQFGALKSLGMQAVTQAHLNCSSMEFYYSTRLMRNKALNLIVLNTCGIILFDMSEYTHAYTGYIDHILNRSPSKTSYTFSRSERFPAPRQQDPFSADAIFLDQRPMRDSKYKNELNPQRDPRESAAWRRQIAKSNKFREMQQRAQKDRQRIRKQYQLMESQNIDIKKDIRRMLNKIGKRSNQSPAKNFADEYQSNYRLRTSPSRQFRASNISPARYESPNQYSPQSPSKSPSSKTLTQYLQEVDHPSKRITAHGYYPTGIQTQADGKYPISTIRNNPGTSFGKSPKRDRTAYLINRELKGPGNYQLPFSQFGSYSRKK